MIRRNPSIFATTMTNVVTTATPDTECGKHVEYLSSQATPRSPSKLGSDPCNPPKVDSKSDISVGDERRGVKDTIELPMPAIQSSCTLRHAEVTLQLCSNRLKQHLRKLLESNLSSVGALSILTEMHHFRPWLESWEKAFSAFLATAMPSLTHLDVRKCRVLKANHLNTFILASVTGVRPTDFEPFVADFKAITELANANLCPEMTPHIAVKVLREKRGMALKMATPFVDSLRFVTSYCTDPAVRQRAAGLLKIIKQKSSDPQSQSLRRMLVWKMRTSTHMPGQNPTWLLNAPQHESDIQHT